MTGVIIALILFVVLVGFTSIIAASVFPPKVRARNPKLHEWQVYWRRWRLGCVGPYPDKSIKRITHFLVFIGPLQLWFYV